MTAPAARRGRRRLSRREALAFVGVVLAGVSLERFSGPGGGASDWPVTVARTDEGWRVTGPAYSSQSVVDLYGMRMIWSNGPCLELLDLRTGEATVLQPPVEDSSSGRLIGAQNATLCDHFVFWAMPSADGTRRVWWPTTSPRESAGSWRPRSTSATSQPPASACSGSGETTRWLHRHGLGTREHRRLLHRRRGLFGVEGSLVAWATRRQDVADVGDARVTVHVRDVGTGVTKRIGVGTQDTLWANPVLAGRTLLYRVSGVEGNQGGGHEAGVFAVDFDSWRRRSVAEVPNALLCADSSVVLWSEYRGDRERVWAQPRGGGERVRTRTVERMVADRDTDPKMSDRWFVVARDASHMLDIARLEAQGLR